MAAIYEDAIVTRQLKIQGNTSVTKLAIRNDNTQPAIDIDNNNDAIALRIVHASTVQAPIRITNMGSDPTGAHVVGDIAVVDTKLKICTVAGTPGTWTVVGTQA